MLQRGWPSRVSPAETEAGADNIDAMEPQTQQCTESKLTGVSADSGAAW
jgi:hypothetical protein